jgi:putative YhbY family RNA-binding protein
MTELTPARRRELRAQAHALAPVAAIGKSGTDAVLREIDRCLSSHGLVKVRDMYRTQQQACLDELVARLECAPVQCIGRVAVLWRPRPEAAQAPAVPTARRDAPHRPKRHRQTG